ncbi:MAG: tetratricopeptide repeat protein [Candidatus Tectomicrobia bacterium]|uniref:Tetratricopeptide repeat protein n=1 Tax=Tectimicrobiota bacterium TaxID=2528274 RepID=A0A932GNH1_UNCTE|nr:tetratricopeptide repeat protein [Candidatus Tectomicrobia bacterium]
MGKKPVLDDQTLMEVYRLRLEAEPDSRLFLPLAVLYRKHGEPDRAIDLCLHGLELYPHYHSARVNLALAYLDRGEVEEAADQVLRVLEVNPNNLLAREILAETYCRRGQEDKAIQEYQTLQQLAPLSRKYDRKIQELGDRGRDFSGDDLPELNPEDIGLEEISGAEDQVPEIPAELSGAAVAAPSSETLPAPSEETPEFDRPLPTGDTPDRSAAAILSILERWLDNIHRLYPVLGPSS